MCYISLIFSKNMYEKLYFVRFFKRSIYMKNEHFLLLNILFICTSFFINIYEDITNFYFLKNISL